MMNIDFEQESKNGSTWKELMQKLKSNSQSENKENSILYKAAIRRAIKKGFLMQDDKLVITLNTETKVQRKKIRDDTEPSKSSKKGSPKKKSSPDKQHTMVKHW